MRIVTKLTSKTLLGVLDGRFHSLTTGRLQGCYFSEVAAFRLNGSPQLYEEVESAVAIEPSRFHFNETS